MKYDFPKENKKAANIVIFYYSLHLLWVCIDILLILGVLGLKVRSLCGLGMHPLIGFPLYVFLFSAIIFVAFINKYTKEAQKDHIEKYIAEFGDDLTSQEWYITNLRRKKNFQIICTIILAIMVSSHFIIPCAENIYRNKVWCKINYTGPYYNLWVNSDLTEYNEKILYREEIISLVEQYASKHYNNLDAQTFLKDDSEKYFVIFYGEENSSGFKLEVYDVFEDGNKADIIVGKALLYNWNDMGTIYEVLFIPISNNIDTVECEWRWHYYN